MTVIASSILNINSPFFILFVSVIWVVIGIAKLKIHPFLTLMSAAILVGLLSSPLPEFSQENKGLFHSRLDLVNSNEMDFNLAIKWSLLGFGNTAGSVGLIIALAAIIGTCMLKSGAADRIVRFLLSIFGEKRAGLVLLLSGFLLSIPVFFDTVFFLLIPIARAMAVRLGGNYLYFVMALAGAGAITHSMVPPTPGPLIIADGLGLEIGEALIAGLIASILPVVIVICLSKWFDNNFDFPMREVAGSNKQSLNDIVNKPETELPSTWLSFCPIVLPVVLISSVSLLKILDLQSSGSDSQQIFDLETLFAILSFFGDPNIAMFLAAIVSLFILAKQSLSNNENNDKSLINLISTQLKEPISTAGIIILITGAGGAYGGMIRLSGVGKAMENVSNNFNISYILLAWLVTAIIRIAQGSATVAMITGVGLMAAILSNVQDLGYHSLYIYLAIGFGSITLSWMNDSGFWVVQRLSGFSEKETLKTWSVLLTAISLVGLISCLLASKLIPLAN